MNQKKGFAVMAGRGLGHSPKCTNQSSLPMAAIYPASQLACRAAQHSGTLILGLNLSLPALHQSRKKATLIFNSTSVQAQHATVARTGFVPLLCHWWLPPVPTDKGSFPASLTGSGSLLWQEDWEGYTVGGRC